MSLGKLKRGLFRARLTSRRVESVRRHMMFGSSIQGPPNAKAFQAYLNRYRAF